jgi:tight adherence protein C
VSVSVIVAAAAVGCGAAVFAVVWAFAPGRAPGILLQRFSESLAIDTAQFDPDDPDMHRPLAERVIQPLLRAAGRFALRLTPGGQIVQVRTRIVQAGLSIRPETLLTLQILAVPFGLAIGILLVNAVGFDPPLNAVIPVALLALGYVTPSVLLQRLTRKRADAVRVALPNVIDLLTISMEAGLAFETAMLRVAETEPSALGQEFQKVLNETRLGKPRGEALMGMAERNSVPELTAFVRAVTQAEPLGVSVANVLRIQSEELRRLRRQRAEQAGHRAPVLMLLPMLGCIFPTVFIMLLGPAIISVMHSFSR